MQTVTPQNHLPDSENLVGLCTRCEKEAEFVISGDPIVLASNAILQKPGGETPSPSERITVLECQKCQSHIAVIEMYRRKPRAEQVLAVSTSKIDDDLAKTTPMPANAQLYWQGVQWWPQKGD